jgi:hypothetical protein
MIRVHGRGVCASVQSVQFVHLCSVQFVHLCSLCICAVCASVHLCICASVHLCICASVQSMQSVRHLAALHISMASNR